MDESPQGIPTAQPASSSKKAWITIAILIVLLAGGYLLFHKGSSTAPTQGSVAGDQNTLTVGDQDADAVAVLVEYVSLRQPGFIAIHDNQKNNTPSSNVLAASSLLSAGEHRNVSIIMKLTPGTSYWAMLHGDDGNGVFDAAKDQPLLDASGSPVMVRFGVKIASGGEIKG